MRAAFLTCFLLSAVPARACDLALVLAVDVSGSVDSREYGVQMNGLAAALRDSVVSEALVRAEAHLALVQWTGSSRQAVAIDWTRIDGFEAADAFARAVEESPRIWRNYSTAIGEALTFAIPLFGAVPECSRRLIDLSGYGLSNEGLDPTEIRPALREAGITVNALAIEESEADLTDYFFENVIWGEGAFAVTAATFDDYPEKIRRKLLREVTRQTASSGR
jgi:Ca-activated chloride channel family protein